jgi:hypothetical protein
LPSALKEHKKRGETTSSLSHARADLDATIGSRFNKSVLVSEMKNRNERKLLGLNTLNV